MQGKKAGKERVSKRKYTECQAHRHAVGQRKTETLGKEKGTVGETEIIKRKDPEREIENVYTASLTQLERQRPCTEHPVQPYSSRPQTWQPSLERRETTPQ